MLKKKFHTAECILQECSFSVNHNLSLLLITNIYILYIVQPHMQYIFLKNVHVHKKLAEVHNDTESVFSVTKCSFKPKPTRIRDGTILIFASTNPVQCTLALLKLKLQNWPAILALFPRFRVYFTVSILDAEIRFICPAVNGTPEESSTGGANLN